MIRAFYVKTKPNLHLIRRKLSTRNLNRLCEETATNELTLIVHSEDVDFHAYFPHTYAVTRRRDVVADLHVDPSYSDLRHIPSQSYATILCSGLLEHVPEPQVLIDQLHRILTPGGRLIISASAVFPIHEGPDDYFHFTPFGFQRLFKDWTRFEILRGSSRPFETISILIQRILMQSDVSIFARPFIELLALVIRGLDIFVKQQYSSARRDQSTSIDSMMPSNIQAVVIK